MQILRKSVEKLYKKSITIQIIRKSMRIFGKSDAKQQTPQKLNGNSVRKVASDHNPKKHWKYTGML